MVDVCVCVCARWAIILAFDVRVEREAQEMADNVGVKIFSADIIYHLCDAFLKHREVSAHSCHIPRLFIPCCYFLFLGSSFLVAISYCCDSLLLHCCILG